MNFGNILKYLLKDTIKIAMISYTFFLKKLTKLMDKSNET